MAMFSSNHSLDLYLHKSLGPCNCLPFFLINVFQKKSLLLMEGLQKNPVYGQHSALSYICDEGVYILYHESESVPWVLSIPWVQIYTLTPCVAIYTMSACLYHESMSIPWVHVRPCQFYASISIIWVLANNMSQCLYHESRNTNNKNYFLPFWIYNF